MAKNIGRLSVGILKQIESLNGAQLDSLQNTVKSALEEKCHKEVFRRARVRHVGVLKYIHELLHDASKDEILKINSHINQ